MTSALFVAIFLGLLACCFGVIVACWFPRYSFVWLWCAIGCLLLFRRVTAWLSRTMGPDAWNGWIGTFDALLTPTSISMLYIGGCLLLCSLLRDLENGRRR